MASNKILIIGENLQDRRNIKKAAQSLGFVSLETSSSNSALDLFDTHSPAATLIDIKLQDGSGLNLLQKIKQRQPEAIVIAAGNSLVEESVAAFRAGAFDFIVKPINFEEVRASIRKAVEVLDLRREIRQHHQEQFNSFNFEQIIGESRSIKETISLARKVAATDVSFVLLQGESGTGKDLFAKAIHFSSSRANEPFLAINCAAIPSNLLESELFGYEKGAFTDAKTLKEGLFEQAEGGTLFLNEISELEIGLQAKLLRVLEERTFRRVGGLRYLPLNVRVIAASNLNLREESQAKRFRLDLYYRLSVIEINLPPLRKREKDVLLLAEHFIKNLDQKWQQRLVHGLSPEAAEVFLRYRWAGNVRELRNVIERASVLEENEQITLKYIPDEILSDQSAYSSHLRNELQKASRYVSLPTDGISLDMVKLSLIQQALERCGGNASRAADLLCISRDRIRYHLRKSKTGTIELKMPNGRNNGILMT
jgi:two-component system response regulator AtoC